MEKSLLDALTFNALEARRILLSARLKDSFNGKISYGPLKGLNIDQYQAWSNSTDLGAKLLGFYEKEILDRLFSTDRRFEFLVNLGAGDGYYGVGLVLQRMAYRSICFESNSISRDSIRACAEVNGVADRVAIFGTADSNFLNSDVMINVPLSKTLFLVDIEGHEFDVLTESNLRRLRDSELIIELHGPFMRNDPEIEVRFLSLLETIFDCEVFLTGPRDPSQIRELAGLNDTDRWLLCSEGRPYLMRWVHCCPRTRFKG